MVKPAASVLAGALVALTAAAGCTSGTTATRTSPTPSFTPTTASTATATPEPSMTSTMAPTGTQPRPTPTHTATQTADAVRVFRSMTEAQRVGQLFMVGASTTGPDAATMSAITTDHVGSVILTGTSYGGVAAIAGISHGLQAATNTAKLFIAADQEGGEVQRLQGPGFDAIPTATQQGAMPPAQLRADARRWGAQLRAAGVNLNLAPVMDTVPAGAPNPPIGAMSRQYGSDPVTVATHGVAFAQGMADAGIDATAKHFPGLGRVADNTDTSAGVTDHVTTRRDAFLVPFAAAVKAGVAFVMMATAYYSRIDPARPAAFSPTIVTGMLRGDLGFRGVVVSDDLGGAAQVAAYAVGARAVDFIAAGGDVVLTVDAGQIPQMSAAVLAAAKADPRFRTRVDAAALRVLRAKQARGLLS
ncbi:MAG TPA: glycoside hydrolase family 3 N-terminal domain-containing protein [Jatrophihabitantaceae bacterium]